MIDEDAIRYRWETIGSKLDERGRRLFAAGEVRTAGWGGLAIVSTITGLARSTINRGEDDLDAAPLAGGRVRRNGGGRRTVSENDLGLVPELKRLVEPATMGDPMRRLLWVSKSMDKLAATLTAMGHPISADTVRAELTKLGFSRQSNRKADEGSKHPDRNAQFEYINARVVATQARKQPVISVDTKKKELIGNYKNAGSDWRPDVAPVWWTPQYYRRRWPRCREEHVERMRQNSDDKWLIWFEPVDRLRSWPRSLSRRPNRSATGWPRPTGMKAAVRTA